MAQPGSAPQWGCGGRRFKSSRPDQSALGVRAFLLGLCGLLGACAETSDPLQTLRGGNYERAVPLLQSAADQGDLAATNYLGILYYLGLGVSKDLYRSRDYFLRAAKRGHPAAQLNLGMMYRFGHGVPQDPHTAYMWFYAADRQGNTRAGTYIKSLAGLMVVNQQKRAQRQAQAYIFSESSASEARAPLR